MSAARYALAIRAEAAALAAHDANPNRATLRALAEAVAERVAAETREGR